MKSLLVDIAHSRSAALTSFRGVHWSSSCSSERRLQRPRSSWPIDAAVYLCVSHSASGLNYSWVHPSTLWGWVTPDWHRGTNFRGAKKSACSDSKQREKLLRDFTELPLMKTIPCEMFLFQFNWLLKGLGLCGILFSVLLPSLFGNLLGNLPAWELVSASNFFSSCSI